MKGKRIIGIVLLTGAIIAFGNKLIDGMSGNSDNDMLIFFLLIAGLLLAIAIGRILRH